MNAHIGLFVSWRIQFRNDNSGTYFQYISKEEMHGAHTEQVNSKEHDTNRQNKKQLLDYEK